MGNLATGKLARACVWKRKMPPMPLRCQAPFTTGFERSCSAPFFTGDESLLTGIRCAACIPLANTCRTRAQHRTRVQQISLDDKLEMRMTNRKCKCHIANLKRDDSRLMQMPSSKSAMPQFDNSLSHKILKNTTIVQFFEMPYTLQRIHTDNRS